MSMRLRNLRMIEFEEKELRTATFWLVNILRNLSDEQLQELCRQVADRCGLIVTAKPALGERIEPPTAVAAVEKLTKEDLIKVVASKNENISSL